LESQRVRYLTEGYLRGWLTFKDSQSFSHIREDIITHYIQEERIYTALNHKLFMETVLRATLNSRGAADIDAIYDVYREMVGMKLPSISSEAKIKKSNKAITKEELAEWKVFLEQMNKKQ
jgi:hypothetical protein